MSGKHPINKIEYIDYISSAVKEQYTYSKQLQEKYGLTNEMLRILDLMSIEEMLALKIEKSAQLFNGKFMFPIANTYISYVKKAIFMLIKTYEKNNKKRKIRQLMLLSKYNKMKMQNAYNYWFEQER